MHKNARSKSPLRFSNIENVDSNLVPPVLTSDEELSLLKRKLVETHRKLLDQLDFGREQEMKILELNRELEEGNRADLEALRNRVLTEMN